jgi:iron complex transport system permease protein
MENQSLEIYNFFEIHNKRLKIKRIYLFLSFVLLIILAVFSLNLGEFSISIFKVLSGKESPENSYIFYNIRLLRVFTDIVCGAGLSIGGAVLQNILRNPMASPFTLGISQAATFGASFAIIYLSAGITTSVGEGVIVSSFLKIGFFAFAFSLISMFFLISLSYIKKFSKHTIILTGISLGAFFQALTMILQYFADEIKVAQTLFWTFGDVSKGNYFVMSLVFVLICFSIYFFVSKSFHFNAILFGDEFSRVSGVDLKKLSVISIIIVSLIVSLITSCVGIIGFIGLIAPHITRFIVKNDNKYFIPLSAINGSIVLLLSDIISRTIIYPSVLPVGIITSFFGVIVLIYLIIRKGKND